MDYTVKYSAEALRTLKKIDRFQAKIIIAWVEKNLIGCDNPRIYGKSLTADLKGLWRYRIGAYRIIADIQDNIVTIEIVDAGHKREIYK